MFRAPQWHGATQTHFPPRPRKSQWRCDITNFASPHGLPRHYRSNMSHDTTNHPATSDTLRLRQPVSRSPVARGHANTLPTQAAQIPMALRHHERRVATRSAHTLEANMSHDTKNHPAHQRHAAFTPACFALPSRTPPHTHTFHQGCANPNGTATSRMSRRHTVCRHTRIVMRAFRTTRSHASRLQDERFVRDFLQKSRVKSSRTRLPPKVTRQVSKTNVSTRLPPKVKRKHPSEHTHHAALPSSFAIPAPPKTTPAHTPIPM